MSEYCVHKECVERAIYELDWMAKILPHKTQLREILARLKSKNQTEGTKNVLAVRCRHGVSEAPLPERR